MYDNYDKKFLAYYLRLSDDDIDIAQKKESESISNQRAIIAYYIKQDKELSKYTPIEFCDDGYSGINFKRPGIQKLLKEIYRGKIYAVIVKDFSRFGRNYIEVGDYIEQIFPFLNVRFISISDNYDSIKNTEIHNGIEVGFKTLIHDLYSRDLSKKMKSVRKLYQEKGYHCGGGVPFGYLENKEKRTQYLVDQTAVPIIRQIFELAAKGITTGKIAEYLNQNSISTRGAYHKENGGIQYRLNNKKNNFWTAKQVKEIIQNEVYIGTYVCRKKYTYHRKIKNTKQEEYLKFKHAHKAIISEKLFWQAQKVIRVYEKKKKYYIKEESEDKFLLKGKVKCGYCGYSMNRINKVKEPYFICRMGNSCHSKTRILIEKLENIVLKNLQYYNFLYNSQVESDKVSEKESFSSKTLKEIRLTNMKIGNLQAEKLRNYENYKKESISKIYFLKKQEKLTASLEEYKKRLEELKNKTLEIDRQKDNNLIFSPILKIKILTRQLAEEFIEKIEVYNINKIIIKFKYKDIFLKI